MEQWIQSLNSSFYELWAGVAEFTPQLVIAIIIVFVGWLIGSVLGRIVAHIFKTLDVDEALRKTGVEAVLQRGGFYLNSSYFLGSLVKWFILIGFLITALNFLGFTAVNEFILEDLLSFLMQVIIAAVVLVIAAVLGDALQRFITGSMKAARLASAEMAGQIIKWIVWIFAVLIALDHLKIVPEAFIHTLLQGVVIAFTLAIGLSFGLGGRRFAEEYIEKMRGRLSEKDVSKNESKNKR